MPTKNTEVLQKIIQVLNLEEPHALARLEDYFKDSLLVVAGNTSDAAQYAEELRLAIIETERGPVLDYIAQHGLAHITIEQVDDGINALYPDPFLEP